MKGLKVVIKFKTLMLIFKLSPPLEKEKKWKPYPFFYYMAESLSFSIALILISKTFHSLFIFFFFLILSINSLILFLSNPHHFQIQLWELHSLALTIINTWTHKSKEHKEPSSWSSWTCGHHHSWRRSFLPQIWWLGAWQPSTRSFLHFSW